VCLLRLRPPPPFGTDVRRSHVDGIGVDALPCGALRLCSASS
jgi:hypothetical protein